MKLRTLGPTLLCAATLCIPAAFAQDQYQGQPQNLGHFYMARQQVHIIDESPQVTRTTVPPGAAGGGNGAQNQPLNRPMALPRAGFQPYFTGGQTMGGPGSGLPQTSNGVPTRAPQGPAGMRSKAGTLRPKATATASQKPASTTPVVKSYNPTGGYGAAPAAGTSSGNSSLSSSSSSQVRGSVMGWKKQKRGF